MATRVPNKLNQLHKSAQGNSIQPVMPGLVPGIHAVVSVPGAWMAGTSPAMTAEWSRIELPCKSAGLDSSGSPVALDRFAADSSSA